MEDVILRTFGQAFGQIDPQCFVECRDSVARVRAVIGTFFGVLAVDDAPVTGLHDRMVRIGIAARSPQRFDVAIGEADRCICQRQAQQTLLRARRPTDDTLIVIDFEILDAERGDGVYEAHRIMLDACIRKALDVVDPA